MNKKILLIAAAGIVIVALAYIDAKASGNNEACFCHNVLNNPITICTADEGLINGHTAHVERGSDSLGECAEPSPSVEPTPSPSPVPSPEPSPSPTPSELPTPSPTPTDDPSYDPYADEVIYLPLDEMTEETDETDCANPESLDPEVALNDCGWEPEEEVEEVKQPQIAEAAQDVALERFPESGFRWF